MAADPLDVLRTGDLVKDLLGVYVSCQDLKLRREISERELEMKERLEEKNRELELGLEKLKCDSSEKNEEQSRRLQIRLAAAERRLQENITKFQAFSQRQSILLEKEKGYSIENFPLYIRMGTYSYTMQDICPVKIVFSPPETFDDPESPFCGIDSFITAKMTEFLHGIYDEETADYEKLYEYVGNAWRDKHYRGQSAYRCIFNEFSSEPFVILDCEIVRGLIDIRYCYWMPGSRDYHLFQPVQGFHVSKLLNENVRKRVSSWRERIFFPLLQAGKQEEEVAAVYPNEYHNHCKLEEEEAWKRCCAEVCLEGFLYTEQDYNACMETIAVICEMIAGSLIDLYHLEAGNLPRPLLLEHFLTSAEKLPDSGGLRGSMLADVIRKYQIYLDAPKGPYRLETVPAVSIPLSPSAEINCRLALAKLMNELGEDTDTRELFKTAWGQWCGRLGATESEIWEKRSSKEFQEMILSEIRGDQELEYSMCQLFEVYKLLGRPKEHQALACLAEWRDRDRENNLLYG